VVKQQLNDFRVVSFDRFAQRRISIPILDVDLRLLGQQQTAEACFATDVSQEATARPSRALTLLLALVLL